MFIFAILKMNTSSVIFINKKNIIFFLKKDLILQLMTINYNSSKKIKSKNQI